MEAFLEELKYVETILTLHPNTANLMVSNVVFRLMEEFFDVRGVETPSMKVRVSKIKELGPEFYALIQQFCKEQVTMKEKLDIAIKMVPLVFEK